MSRFVDRLRRQFADARPAKRAGLILLLLGAFAVVGTSAWAYWTTTGTGTASATTGTLNPPTNVVASSTAGTGTVHLTWTGSTLSNGTAAQGYYATRNSGPAPTGCGTQAAPLAVFTCNDTGVVDGTYTYTVTAVYGSWTATSGASNSVSVVNAVGTTTAVSSSVNPSVVGQSVTYTATVTQTTGAATPTGTVTFKDGTSTITCASGSLTLNIFGGATCQLTYTGTGSHSITAVYAGAGNFTASTSTAVIQAVNPASQTLTFTSTAVTPTFGGSYTVAATATSGLTVTFTSATTATCTASGSTVSFVGVGTCTINADQVGSANYNAAPQVAQTFAVVKANQTITFTSVAPGAATFNGSAYTVTATGGGSGNPVTFTSATAPVCTVSGSTTSFVGVGTCTINANQALSTNYNAAPQVQQSFSVAKANQSVTFTSTALTPTFGGSYTVAATATSGLTVTFTSATTAICTASGSTASFVGVGTCTINADQVGGANYNAAPQVVQSFSVAKANQSITFTSTPLTPTFGGSYTVAATASSGLTVAFSSATTAICTVSGSSVSFVGAGSCTINANRAGDANYNPATQAQQSFTVAKGAQTVGFISTAPTTATVGGATYNVTASASSGLTVSFSSATPSVCSVATSTVSFIAVGTCTINANQAGDANYNPATQAQQSFTVAKGAQTVGFISTAPTTATVGGATYSVTASASSGLAVSFTSATTGVCTVTAGSTVSFIAAGSCTVNANQIGNANYNASPQVQQSFAVSNPPSAPTGLTIRQDGSNKVTPSWTPIGGLTYECQITAGAAAAVANLWATCTSGTQYSGQNGSHTFYVRAVRGGAPSPPASQAFSA